MMSLVSDMLDDFLLYQALANPKKSTELRDFIQDVFHSEAQPLFREHNEAIQMQHSRILELTEEVQRLQATQLKMHAGHAAEVQALHAGHAAEVQALHASHAAEVQVLHASYTGKLVDEHSRHAAEVQALYRNAIEKLKDPVMH